MMECIQAGKEKRVSRACNLVPCSQMEVVEQLQYNSHITAEEISQVRTHHKIEKELIRTSNNKSLETESTRDILQTQRESGYPMDKLDIGMCSSVLILCNRINVNGYI